MPSDYAGYPRGSLQAYLFDAGMAFRMSREDRKIAAAKKAEQAPGSLASARTDFELMDD